MSNMMTPAEYTQSKLDHLTQIHPNHICVDHSDDNIYTKLRRWWRRLFMKPYKSLEGDYFLTVDFYYDPIDNEYWIHEE